MMKPVRLVAGAAAAAALLLAPARAGARPNIIIVLADDMGFSDLGCYGSEIETPHLDRLAATGLRFTQFYNTGRCCPTRASLNTGLHPHQTGIGHMTETPAGPSPLVDDPYQGYLNQHCVTIAQLLGTAGYHTMMTGKWHLGTHRRECWPLQRGFDRYFGVLAGGSDYFHPTPPRGLTLDNDPVEPAPDFYTTDTFTDYACRFIEEAVRTDDRPFFLYLAYNAPHWPLESKPELLKKYEGRYRDGWEAVSRRRWQRQQAMGLIDPAWDPAPHEGPAWDSLSPEEQRLQDLRMAAYAGCVEAIDQNVGKLVARLKALGVYKNTLLLFLSDNGGCAEGGALGSGKERSIRDPRSTTGVAGPRYGRVWAQVSNTPFRLYKHFVHEGGMATPLIAHWPGGIDAARHGSFVRAVAYLPDLMATCLELAGATYPAAWHGRPLPRPAGKSLLPTLRQADGVVHKEPLFWEHEGNRAMRDGKWKLVWARQGPWELYDMERDRTEMHNLAEALPDRAADMQFAWESWARRTGVQFQTSFNYYNMYNRYTRRHPNRPAQKRRPGS